MSEIDWIKQSALTGLKHLTRGVMGIVTLQITNKYDRERHIYLAYCTVVAYTAYLIGLLRTKGIIAKIAIGLGTALEMSAYIIVVAHVCFERKEEEELILLVVGFLVFVSLYSREFPTSGADEPEMHNNEWMLDLTKQGLGMIMELGGALVGAMFAGFYKENQRTLYWLIIYALVGFVAFKEMEMLNNGYIADGCFVIGYIAMFSLIVTSLLIFSFPMQEGLFLLVCYVVVGVCILPDLYMKERLKKAGERLEIQTAAEEVVRIEFEEFYNIDLRNRRNRSMGMNS